MLSKFFTLIYFLIVGSLIGYVWLFTANQYQSKAYFTITQEDASKEITAGITDILSSGSNSNSDTQLLLGYITSADLLKEIEQHFELAIHYQSPQEDLYFRLDPEAQLEERLKYYRGHITATFNQTTGLSEISAWTFKPELSQKILEYILTKSEDFVNQMNTTIAREKLTFVENQLAESEQKVLGIQRKIATFQNEQGMISPLPIIQAQLETINTLTRQTIELKVQIAATESKDPGSPRLDKPRKELSFLEEEIKQMNATIAGPEGQNLNSILAQFQDFEGELAFAMGLRQTTQALLEQTRVDTISRTRFFTKVQSPFFPEEALFPDKEKLTFTIAICSILIFSIISALTRSMFDRM